MNTIADIHALLKPTVEVPDEVLQRYQEPHRFYHTLDHLADLLSQIGNSDHAGNKVLMLAAVYHDVIYNPRSTTNEEDSARYFNEHYEADRSLKEEVIQLILDTRTHQPQNELSKIFCRFDLDILEQPLDRLITYEHQIFKEFQFVDHSVYRAKRVEVLRQLSREVNNPHLDSLITYVQTRQPQIALYPGSFNPFHKGHYNILQKAEQIFDKVIIARGVNREKAVSTYEFPKALELRQVVTYDGLLTDHVNTLEYPVTVIRGLRNSTDLQYELNQYRYLQDLSGNSLRIVSIFCDREYEHISSTGIRQLEVYGKADDYLM